MTSSWDDIFNSFYFKVQNCPEFFNYYNVCEEEAMDLAKERATGLLIESISRINFQCIPDVDFHDYDLSSEQFNFEVTDDEVDLFAELMFERFLAKDMAKLRVFPNILSSQDLKYAFSGANERTSFISMFSKLQEDNKALIKAYVSKDRLTGKRKFPEYSL